MPVKKLLLFPLWANRKACYSTCSSAVFSCLELWRIHPPRSCCEVVEATTWFHMVERERAKSICNRLDDLFYVLCLYGKWDLKYERMLWTVWKEHFHFILLICPFFHCQHLFPSLFVFFLASLCVFHSILLKAFAWWSDLMVEHAETFLCLYSADMDAALEVQPPDSWDSFPLFQLLNDFLRMDCKSGAIMRNIQYSDWCNWTCRAVKMGNKGPPIIQPHQIDIKHMIEGGLINNSTFVTWQGLRSSDKPYSFLALITI